LDAEKSEGLNMLEFIHDITESWILQATAAPLGGVKTRLLRGHLEHCARCRGFALDLVEFSHGLEAPKGAARLAAAERDQLHAQVMAAFHRERLDERMALRPFERAAGPLVRPGFFPALGLTALVLAAVYVLSIPYRQSSLAPQPSLAAEASVSEQAANALEPTPTPTLEPSKNTAIPQATPQAGSVVRTESK
jgi:hypothetical protein